MKRSLLHAVGLTVLGLLLFFARVARADVEGTVVRVDPKEIVVDVGSGQGLEDGALLELWRPYRVTHPLTGKVIIDRFRIGTIRLVQARPSLSLGVPEGEMEHGVAAGDLVIKKMAKPAVTPVEAPIQTAQVQPKVPPTKQAPTPTPTSTNPYEGLGRTPTFTGEAKVEDVEAKELGELFDKLAGRGPIERVKAYLVFVSQHPRSRYVAVLRDEASQLTRAATRIEVGEPNVTPAVPELVSFTPPDEAYSKRPLHVALELDDDAKSAILYARSTDRLTYEALPMGSMGKGYFGCDIPANLVRAPRVEYFVEAIGPTGETVPVYRSAASPNTTAIVDQPVPEPPHEVKISLAVWTDFAVFNTKQLNDWTSQTEGVVTARYDDVGIRAVRMGFGIYRGEGGTLNELDVQHRPPRPVGLTYGYLEGEFGFHPIFSMIVRGILGLREVGLDGGTQIFFRIGNDLKTNLALGGEVIGGMGVRGIAQLEWNTIPRVPIVIRSEVTNQPAGFGSPSNIGTTPSGQPLAVPCLQPGGPQCYGSGDIGVRIIGQVGYRITNAFTVSIRGSYQGRNIVHSGPGGGAALSYQW